VLSITASRFEATSALIDQTAVVRLQLHETRIEETLASQMRGQTITYLDESACRTPGDFASRGTLAAMCSVVLPCGRWRGPIRRVLRRLTALASGSYGAFENHLVYVLQCM
jgi:hypothetical protein